MAHQYEEQLTTDDIAQALNGDETNNIRDQFTRTK